LKLPEGTDIGKEVNDAMKAIEAENDDLRDVLPRTSNRLDNDTVAFTSQSNHSLSLIQLSI